MKNQPISEPLSEIRDRLEELNDRFEGEKADEVLSWAWETFGPKAVIGTGFGVSGIFLIDRIVRLGIGIPVFFLDTRLLFDQTYDLRKRLEERLGIEIEAIRPELTVEQQAEKHGDKLWERNPDQCCHIRKVLPLQGYLADKQAWITGIRRGQSRTRKSAPILEYEANHEVIKINPVAAYTPDRIWDYIRSNDLPYNPMHDEGYPSIGCIPCTSPVADGEQEREGRWRGNEKVECGIHFSPETGKFERAGPGG